MTIDVSTMPKKSNTSARAAICKMIAEVQDAQDGTWLLPLHCLQVAGNISEAFILRQKVIDDA